MQTLYRPCTGGEEAGRYASHVSVTLSEKDMFRPCAAPLHACSPRWALSRPCEQALFRVSVTSQLTRRSPFGRAAKLSKGLIRPCAGCQLRKETHVSRTGRHGHSCSRLRKLWQSAHRRGGVCGGAATRVACLCSFASSLLHTQAWYWHGLNVHLVLCAQRGVCMSMSMCVCARHVLSGESGVARRARV